MTYKKKESVCFFREPQKYLYSIHQSLDKILQVSLKTQMKEVPPHSNRKIQKTNYK
jgi:hypothetical protein